MGSEEDGIVVGKITKPFGLKGGFRVQALTEDPDRFLNLTTVTLESPDGVRAPCLVSDVRVEPKGVTLFCREFTKVEEIAPFIGGSVRIPEAEAVSLPEGSYFQHDLLGMAVFLEDGAYLGEVRDILSTGSNDVLVVGEGTRETLIPALKSVVVRVDLKEKKITIRPMKGML